MIQASICTIGDEILIGQIIDTNSSRISRALEDNGVKVTRMLSIGDEHDAIVSCLENELKSNPIVITTGGLGPTKDDITKAALAELSGSKRYVQNVPQLEVIHEILHSRGLDALDINKAQAMVPETCEVIVNRKGTAPIMVFRFPSSRFGHEATLYSLPGVPYEAAGALQDVIDDIRTHNKASDIFHRCVMVSGLAESALSELIEPWETALPSDMHLAYLPGTLKGVRLRLSVYGGEKNEAVRRMAAQIELLKPYLGNRIYSLLDEGLEAVIGRLLKESGCRGVLQSGNGVQVI